MEHAVWTIYTMQMKETKIQANVKMMKGVRRAPELVQGLERRSFARKSFWPAEASLQLIKKYAVSREWDEMTVAVAHG